MLSSCMMSLSRNERHRDNSCKISEAIYYPLLATCFAAGSLDTQLELYHKWCSSLSPAYLTLLSRQYADRLLFIDTCSLKINRLALTD